MLKQSFAIGCALVSLTLAFSARAADESPRPRIGLVLSGGGARGGAHVGALKVLEELRVPIDAIAGTSMGAVVGGLYASGMSAQEIERLLLSLDWQDAFSDRMPRRDLGFRRKQDDRNFLVRYALGIDSNGFKLPTGLIQGQKLAQVLRAATLPVAEIRDFDRLPVAFRAVATDLTTGDEVVMRAGDLVTAMRASMSAPAVFVPAERDGRLLVDGGLTQNLPVDVARQMNVDILIVIDVSFPLYAREELTSPLEMTLQASAIMIRSRTLEQRAKLQAQDVIIDPILGSLSSADFARVAFAREAGERAARASEERLRPLALSAEAYSRYLAERNPRATPTPTIQFVAVDAASKRYEPRVRELLREQVGKPLDKDKVERNVAELHALDLFQSVDYAVADRDAERGLEFSLRRKSWGPNYVRIGLNIEDDFEGNSRYNAAARFIATELNALNGEWLTDLQIGDESRVYSEFYQPLGYAHRYFIAPHLGADVRNLEVRDPISGRISDYRVRENLAGLDVGRELRNWGEWRAGIFRGASSSRVRVGDITLPQQNFSSGGVFARLSYDRLDSVFFPRYGQQFTLEWTGQRPAMGADRTSDRAEVGGLAAHSFGKNTLIVSANAGVTLNAQTYPQDYFQLGGFLNLSGLHIGELAGPQYGVGRLLYYRKVGSGVGVFQMPFYLGASAEAGNVWQQRRDMSLNDLRKNGSLFIGADSILGPIFLGAGADTSGNTAFYLSLGRTF